MTWKLKMKGMFSDLEIESPDIETPKWKTHLAPRKTAPAREFLKDDFAECDSCAAKPGSPALCPACLHNRALVEKLKGKK